MLTTSGDFRVNPFIESSMIEPSCIILLCSSESHLTLIMSLSLYEGVIVGTTIKRWKIPVQMQMLLRETREAASLLQGDYLIVID